MGHKWDDIGRASEEGPIPLGLKILGVIIFFVAVIGIVGYAFSWFGDAGKVAKEEFSASALLEKYEWFKDASASLDAKRANIEVYEKDLQEMTESYGNTSRKDWNRDDREFYQQRSTEIAGIKASYNKLASEYNSQMSKFNWRFTNAGDMPKGFEDRPALPREYREYVTK